MANSQESFGQIIRTFRKKRKMTQKMLAEDICSQSVLSRIENNEELPNVLGHASNLSTIRRYLRSSNDAPC